MKKAPVTTTILLAITLIVLMYFAIIGVKLANIKTNETSFIKSDSTMVRHIDVLSRFDISDSMLQLLKDTITYFEYDTLKPYSYKEYSYIGRGHQIKHSERWLLKGITKHQSDSILHTDLLYYIQVGYQYTNIVGNKLLCVADFLYCYGSGKFLGSTLYYYLMYSNDTVKIKQELFKWNKVDGKVHKRLVKRREFNWWLYNKK